MQWRRRCIIMFGEEGSIRGKRYKCSLGTAGADRITLEHIYLIFIFQLILSFFGLKITILFEGTKSKAFFSDQEMDNWKIQLAVVTFCALVQTYQALSSTMEEERWLPEDWQVSIISNDKLNLYCRNAMLLIYRFS